jgi:hypothetical protein
MSTPTLFTSSRANPAKKKLDAATKAQIPIVSYHWFEQQFQCDSAATEDSNLE